jgi:hypothetical protein
MSQPNPWANMPNPNALYESWWPIIIAFTIRKGGNYGKSWITSSFFFQGYLLYFKWFSEKMLT